MRRAVLIVEDDHDTNEAISEVLTGEGYSCLATLEGERGLSLLEQHHPDLVVLDLALPDITGVEFLLRKSRNHAVAQIPVVVITGLADPPLLDNIVAVLKKPFAADELLAFAKQLAPSGSS